MTPELAHPSPALLAHVVGDTAVIAAIFRKLAIVERIAFKLAIDRRAMTTEMAANLRNGNLAFPEVKRPSAVNKGELRIAKGHAYISKAKPLFL